MTSFHVALTQHTVNAGTLYLEVVLKFPSVNQQFTVIVLYNVLLKAFINHKKENT